MQINKNKIAFPKYPPSIERERKRNESRVAVLFTALAKQKRAFYLKYCTLYPSALQKYLFEVGNEVLFQISYP